MLVGVFNRASLVGLLAPTPRALLAAAVAGVEFTRPLAAVFGVAVCAALLFIAPVFIFPPRLAIAEFAFVLVLAMVAWLALVKFAGRIPVCPLAVTTPRFAADAGGTPCVCGELPPSTDDLVGFTLTLLSAVPLLKADAGTAPPTRFTAAPLVNAELGAPVTAPGVLRNP